MLTTRLSGWGFSQVPRYRYSRALAFLAAELDQAGADLELDLGESLFAARQLGQIVSLQVAVEGLVQLLVGLGLQVDVGDRRRVAAAGRGQAHGRTDDHRCQQKSHGMPS